MCEFSDAHPHTKAILFSTIELGADGENGTLRIGNNLVDRRMRKMRACARETALPVNTEYDQIRIPFIGSFQDSLGG